MGIITNEATKYSVHRFGDKVAMWDGIDETIYLSPTLALELADTLMIFSHDIEIVKFTDSNLTTREVEA